AVGTGWDDPHDDLHVSARSDALVLLNPALDIHYSAAIFHNDQKLAVMSYINKRVPPMLILSGSKDQVISADLLKDYAHQLQTAGARCELHIYPDQVHTFYRNEPYLTETNAQIIAFLHSLGYVYL
ncbi:MAG: dienelactone hydrolase family protein, partial [Terriglobus sp.]